MSEIHTEITYKFDVEHEDFQQWLKQPITEKYMEALKVSIHNTNVMIGNGGTVDYQNSDKTQALTGRANGIIEGLKIALNMSPAKPKTKSEQSRRKI